SDVAKNLDYDHLLIISSYDGLDELSVSSESIVYEIKKNQVKSYKVNASRYGFKKTNSSEILGNTKKENAEIIKNILDGKKGPKRDIVLLNSAFALYVGDIVSDVKKGIKLAEKSIDSGKAKLVLEKLIYETKKYA
ncbi:anthranilate phosphoribosyltransferase, partial [Candidatus Roizmanbacteria bacterium]|nr:anthranilate phosphoribosyltransferase [Candidatus Roizmanbacteria bacterium]